MPSFKLVLLNCFLLLLPIFFWNQIFWKKLMQVSRIGGEDRLKWLALLENILRMIVFLLPLFMPLRFNGGQAAAGWLFYILGSLLYYSSWILLMYKPASKWSGSKAGLLAPAYTTVFWLTGMGLIGGVRIYLLAVLIFVLVHVSNTAVNIK